VIGVGYVHQDLTKGPLVIGAVQILFSLYVGLVWQPSEKEGKAKLPGTGVARYYLLFMTLYLLVTTVSVILVPQQFVSTWGTSWQNLAGSTLLASRSYGINAGTIALTFLFVALQASRDQQKRFLLFNIPWYLAGISVAAVHRDTTFAPVVVVPLLLVGLIAAVLLTPGEQGAATKGKGAKAR